MEADPDSEKLSFTASLSAGEKDWKWKMGFRGTLLILDIIGIGTIAWIITYMVQGYTNYFIYDSWTLPWGLITLSLSFVWCFIVILVLVLRKRPVHPGFVVAVDLILWLGLIMTGLLAISGAWSLFSFGADGEINDPTSSGIYILQDNGTWAWNVSSYYYTYYNYYDDPNEIRHCTKLFRSCAEQDAFINEMWQEKTHLTAVEGLAITIQYLGVLLHVILFIWGCVDTHRWRATRTTEQARQIAEKIIQDMTARGQIVPMQNLSQPLLSPSEQALQGTGSPLMSGHQSPVLHPYQQQPPPPFHEPSLSPRQSTSRPLSTRDPDVIAPSPVQPRAT